MDINEKILEILQRLTKIETILKAKKENKIHYIYWLVASVAIVTAYIK